MGYGKTKTLHTGENKKELGSTVLWLLAFPALHWDKKVEQSYLLTKAGDVLVGVLPLEPLR